MKQGYWLNRWETGNIRFNEPHPHRFLTKHFNNLSAAHKDKKMFFPFCGASIDMSWVYRQGFFVSGVDISPIAIAKYINDNKLACDTLEQGNRKLFSNASHSLHLGDIFSLSNKDLSDYNLIYDRGGFTALPPATIRLEYVEWLKNVLLPASKILLITFEHGNPSVTEPPFSVSTNQLEQYFCSHFTVEPLEHEEIREIKPHWADRGVRDLYECAHLLTKKK